jgi:hypothetical protein
VKSLSCVRIYSRKKEALNQLENYANINMFIAFMEEKL